MSAPLQGKLIYFFGSGRADGNASMKDILGGKGAGLADMSRMGLPVPPGFTISTEVCRMYYRGLESRGEERARIKKAFLDLLADYRAAIKRLERTCGKKLGDSKDPLLVSVRSGAKISMPGMMDTILNLGLNDQSVESLARQTQDRRFALDSYRRFIQMFGDVVYGIPHELFEEELIRAKRKAKVVRDSQLTASQLAEVVKNYQAIYRRTAKHPFPQNPMRQLKFAVEAVFKSWMTPRAQAYRKQAKISEDMGTACTVQAMVFGNRGSDSGTGVGFTRDPANGERKFYGEYLTNAQGEDVVAGIRTPKPLAQMKSDLPAAFKELVRVSERLEKHYRDMQDFEFTIERNKLYMLQTRSAKRTAIAALRSAVEMVDEGLISKKDAIMRVTPEQLDQLLRPVFDPAARKTSTRLAKGLPAGPGAACGRIAFSSDRAVQFAKNGPVVLVRPETSPDDIHGMIASQGILTATGGLTSHASVVGRGLGKVCVVGCADLQILTKDMALKVDGHTLSEGDYLSLDGFSGEVLEGEVPTIQSEILRVLLGELGPEHSSLFRVYERFMSWVDAERKIGVRSNADMPEDARTAIALGAEGIGLCRTEHMFFAEDRVPKMIKMIISSTEAERRAALEGLFPLQKDDFKGLFRKMKGFPVTIRTLDPPLHEFLPRTHFQAKEWCSSIGLPLKKVWKATLELKEQNPMLGHRGCRLGITFPEITEMQARAILSAACEVRKEGIKVQPEIMIPLVGTVSELRHQKAIVLKVAEQVFAHYRIEIPFRVGTMIEVPRACLNAASIADEAEFFSFGTNDLTQMTLGLSRDDYGKFIHAYLDAKLFADDPFQTLDQEGVGGLMQIAVQKGRSSKKDLKIGICGEHGGEPRSIAFCHKIGLNYVSASPYRVPIARLAAAQAALKN